MRVITISVLSIYDYMAAAEIIMRQLFLFTER
jgi:hypothetical protein